MYFIRVLRARFGFTRLTPSASRTFLMPLSMNGCLINKDTIVTRFMVIWVLRNDIQPFLPVVWPNKLAICWCCKDPPKIAPGMVDSRHAPSDPKAIFDHLAELLASRCLLAIVLHSVINELSYLHRNSGRSTF